MVTLYPHRQRVRRKRIHKHVETPVDVEIYIMQAYLRRCAPGNVVCRIGRDRNFLGRTCNFRDEQKGAM